MQRIIIFITAITLFVFAGDKTKEASMNISNKEKVVALLKSLETGDPSPVGYINSEKYIQHNLMVGDGLKGFGELLKQVPKGSLKVNVIRVFSEGNYVFAHTDYDFFGPKAGFDIFRFENGKIVEHWDNLTEKAKAPNPSGHTQFDGSTKISDIDKTKDNKKLVADFVKTILVEGKFDKLGNYFNGDSYIQHNTVIADGLSGLGKALESMAKQGIKMIYDKNHMVFGEGNFVLSVSEGQFSGKHVAFYDLFRVENQKIAEHWDIIEKIPSKDKWANTNGKF
ncbi:MAG: nuclear transport factor 2 family protein [Candidatus Firestonebacteria bacterium]